MMPTKSERMIAQVLRGTSPQAIIEGLADASPEGTPPEDETPGSPGGTPAPEGWYGAKPRKYVMGSYAKERGVSPEGSPSPFSPSASPAVSPAGSPADAQVEWREDAVAELREMFHARGLKTRVLAVPLESFDFIQGALESDDKRHQNLARALEAGQAIPPLLSTPAGGGRQRVLDGHHRILVTVQRLRPPYPRMRTVEVTYSDGRPFSWKDGELGKQLFKAVPGYRRRVAEAGFTGKRWVLESFKVELSRDKDGRRWDSLGPLGYHGDRESAFTAAKARKGIKPVRVLDNTGAVVGVFRNGKPFMLPPPPWPQSGDKAKFAPKRGMTVFATVVGDGGMGQVRVRIDQVDNQGPFEDGIYKVGRSFDMSKDSLQKVSV